MRKLVVALAALMAAGVPLSAARAQSIDANLTFCTTTNCNAVVLGGQVNRHEWNLSGGSSVNSPHFGAGPWVMPVRAGLQECLRLDVKTQSIPLEMVVVSPSGVIWRNAFRGNTSPCPTCPLIKINGTNQSGYYVVHINPRDGAAIDGNFSLAYGRYNKDNPNCKPATPPLT